MKDLNTQLNQLINDLDDFELNFMVGDSDEAFLRSSMLDDVEEHLGNVFDDLHWLNPISSSQKIL